MGMLLDIWRLRALYLVPLFFIICIPVITEISESEMPKEASRCLYCLLVMALTWLTESLPITATALFPLFLFPMMGVMTAKATGGSYVNDTSLLFMGGLIVAVAVEEWQLHKRIAVGVMMIVGSDPKWVLAGLMLPTWFLSMWISNTATTSMMLPIAVAVLGQIESVNTEMSHGKDTKKSNGVTNEGFEDGDEKSGKDIELKDPTMVELDFDHEKEEARERTAEEEAAHKSFVKLSKGLTMSIAYAANIGGIATLTGTPPNLVLKGVADDFYKDHQPVDDQSGSPISYANWMGMALPLSAIVLVLAWILLVLIFVAGRGCCTANEVQARAIKQTIKSEWKKLGPVSFAEIIVLCLFVSLGVMWVSRDPKESPGWSVWFEYDEKVGDTTRHVTFPSDTTAAMLISVLLFILPAKIPNIGPFRTPERAGEPVYTPILTWEQVNRKLPWGVIFLLGGGFALAKGVQTSDLDDWLGRKLSTLDYLDKWVLNLAICLIVAAQTEVTSNTATATLIMPILANLAKTLGYNPLYLMISAGLATSFAFMLPVATVPNAIVFSYGAVKVPDMAFAGIFMNLIAVGVLTVGVNTWGVAIYDFDYFDPIFNTTETSR